MHYTFQGRKSLTFRLSHIGGRACRGRKPTCNFSCWSHSLYIGWLNVNWPEDKYYSLDAPLSKVTPVFASCLTWRSVQQRQESRSLLPLSPLAQVSAQPLGWRSLSPAKETCSHTVWCQTDSRGQWRRTPACSTLQPAARALSPAAECTGRKKVVNLLFPLLVVQEEHRGRYKSLTKLDASPGFRAIRVHWSPKHAQFWNCSPLPSSMCLSLKKEGFEGDRNEEQWHWGLH